jgi:oligoribonuclease NrnB/cAMP/cGMP phosphodiesterase (DHH superfamily)
MLKSDICIYHSPCQDGFGAAYAVWKKYGDEVEYFPTTYYQPPPNVTGRNVVMCDFSYKAPVLIEMAAVANCITILDHHKTADEEVWKAADKMPWLDFDIDMNRSGAVITWEYYHPDIPVPKLLQHIGDRDLWRFELEGTREISSALFSYDYDFKVFDRLTADCELPEGWGILYAQGASINRKHDKDIRELLKLTTRYMTIAGVAMPVANMPYTMASDAGNIMAKEYGGMAATYFDSPEGRKFSLRSIGDIDVAKMAQKYGGGGHKNASGFTQEIGWEGDS